MNKKKLLFLPFILMILGVAALFIYINNSVDQQKNNYAKATIGIADDPAGRIEWERKLLADPANGKIPENIRAKELQYAKNLPKVEDITLRKTKGINTSTWNARGPINRGGRTRALAIDVRTQTAPNITIIAGGASGGIYKSTDNGATWTNKLHPDSIHSITCIAQDTRSGFEDTWYVGTGERGSNGLNGFNGELFLGDGIYKSTDNGENWTLLPSTSKATPQSFNSAFNFVFNIAVNKTNGHIFAAALNSLQRSTDGGATWSLVRGALTNNSYSDVQITSTGVIYVTFGSGLTNAGISKSTNDGATWTTITPAGFPSVYGRNVIGIAPSNENTVYFWVYTASGATGTQMWKTTDGGSTWTNVTSKLPAPSSPVAGINPQGSYNMVIRVKPDDPNFVIFGSTNLNRTTDGFATAVPATGSTNWIGGYAIANNISQYANHHPDQHSFVYLTSNPKIVYSGHDGGISKSTDVTAANVTWSDLNTGYVTSQFYAFDIDPNTANDPVIAGGMQDNGNYSVFGSTFNTPWKDWNHGGDGGYAGVRKTGANEYTIYLEAQNGWLWRQKYNTSGTNTDDDFIQPSYTGSFAFVNPFTLDQNVDNLMYFAQGDSVLRSTNVDATTPTWSVMGNGTPGASVSALATSKTPANILFIGGSNGKVMKVTGANAGDPAGTDISSGLPTGYVSCIAVDPTDANNIIVVFSNYSVKSVWSSDDGGSTWSDISGNLEENPNGTGNGPSVRWVTAVTFGGQTVFYAATSTGLYSTSTLNATSTVWAQEGSTVIGNVVCPMVKGREADGLVVVATHGAGVYSATQTVVSVEDELGIPTQYTLSQNYPNPFNPSTKINFSLPQTGKVVITLFDALGRKVKDIVDQEFAVGNHSLNFDASNLTSGVYFYRLQSNNFVQTKKMILLR